MARRNQDRPYRELGDLLRSWREPQYRSALALTRDHKFSFSYSTYADMEKGAALPTIEQLIEVADFFNQPLEDAVFTWARVQMPSEQLQRLFRTRQNQTARALYQRTGDKPTPENSWVLGPADLDLLLKVPMLNELLNCLTRQHPEEVPFRDLDLQGLSADEFCEQYLNLWLNTGYMQRSKSGLRLRYPHIYVPRTGEFLKLRQKSVSRAVERIFQANPGIGGERETEAHAGVLVRALSPGQRTRWVHRLQALEAEFKAERYEAKEDEEETLFTLVTVFGARELGIYRPGKRKKRGTQKR